LLAGASFKRWFWRGLEIGTIFGLGFVHWLIFQALYRINALCPYCMVVWVLLLLVERGPIDKLHDVSIERSTL
jgi:uncharacterized membrane protein